MFIIIAIGVASGVIAFYGHPLDIREKEAGILADKAIECFVNKGFIAGDGIGEGNFEERCGLSFKDIKHTGEGQYFVLVKKGEVEMEFGNKKLEPLCYSAESPRNKPICSTKKLFVLDEKGEFIALEVKAGVLKIKENAK